MGGEGRQGVQCVPRRAGGSGCGGGRDPVPALFSRPLPASPVSLALIGLVVAGLARPGRGDYFQGDGRSDHKFLFIVGAHHSGTSLMNLLFQQHASVSGLTQTHKPEDEGQHVQDLYKAAKDLGGMTGFAHHRDAMMDETSPLVTEENRLRLYKSWATYWNTSRPVLLEKSPRHVVMTPFLQAMFSPRNSYFASIIRHPLGATHFRWGRYPRTTRKDCGRALIEHWLRQYTVLAEHFPRLEHKIIFQFEHMLAQAPQQRVEGILNWIGLNSSIDLSISTDPLPAKPRNVRSRARYPPLSPAYVNVLVELGLDRDRYERFIHHPLRMIPYDDNAGLSEIIRRGNQRFFEERRRLLNGASPAQEPTAKATAGAGPGRRLLMFRGQRTQVVVHVGSELKWAQEWAVTVDLSSAVCKQMVADLEPQVRAFGYSLVNLTQVSPPTVFMASSDISPW